MKFGVVALVGVVAAALLLAFAPMSAKTSDVSDTPAPSAELSATPETPALGCPSQAGACASKQGATCPSSLAATKGACCAKSGEGCPTDKCCAKDGAECPEGELCARNGAGCPKAESCEKLAACRVAKNTASAELPQLKGTLSLGGGCCPSAKKAASGCATQSQAATCPMSQAQGTTLCEREAAASQ
jgi:hypothetical protein